MTTLKRAVLKSYAGVTHRASVQIAGSLSVWLESIPVADDIPAAELVAGRECAVLFFTDDNPDDAVLICVYGATPSGVGKGSRLQDADNDTYVDTEQNPDEDQVRIGTAGVERIRIDSVGAVNIGNVNLPAGGTVRTQIGNNAALTANQTVLKLSTLFSLGSAVATVIGLTADGAFTQAGFVLTNLYGFQFAPNLSGASGGSVTNYTACRTAPGLTLSGLFTTMRHFHAARSAAMSPGAGAGTALGLDIDNLAHANIGAAIGIRVADQLASAVAYHAQFLGPTVDLLRFTSGNPPNAGLAAEGDSGLWLGWMENGAMVLRRCRSKTFATLAAGDRVMVAV